MLCGVQVASGTGAAKTDVGSKLMVGSGDVEYFNGFALSLLITVRWFRGRWLLPVFNM